MYRRLKPQKKTLKNHMTSSTYPHLSLENAFGVHLHWHSFQAVRITSDEEAPASFSNQKTIEIKERSNSTNNHRGGKLAAAAWQQNDHLVVKRMSIANLGNIYFKAYVINLRMHVHVTDEACKLEKVGKRILKTLFRSKLTHHLDQLFIDLESRSQTH